MNHIMNVPKEHVKESYYLTIGYLIERYPDFFKIGIVCKGDILTPLDPEGATVNHIENRVKQILKIQGEMGLVMIPLPWHPETNKFLHKQIIVRYDQLLDLVKEN